jgi:hypothetical protein
VRVAGTDLVALVVAARVHLHTQLRREVLRLDAAVAGADRGALDDGEELAHVARPGVRAEEAHGEW